MTPRALAVAQRILSANFTPSAMRSSATALGEGACNGRLLAPAPRLHSMKPGNGVGKFYTRRGSAELARSGAHGHEHARFFQLTSKFLRGLASLRDVAVPRILSENFTFRFCGATGGPTIPLRIPERSGVARILRWFKNLALV